MGRLEARSLTKRYAQDAAVEEFSHVFAEGRITAILGPSGSGKSTTLGMIAGLCEPDAGQLSFDGQDITRLPAERRNFGVIFQSYALFPHLTVEENVAFPLRVRRVARPEQAARVRETLELVRIPHLAGRRIHQISGGEQQRVAVARALAFRPRVLLMDEPLSALDAKLRDEVRAELSRLLGELAITTIYVTHDQTEALSLGDELIILNRGRIEQVGPPTEVYQRPASVFVSKFLGSANVWPGEVEGSALRLPFASLPLRERHPPGACWAMVRPEDIELAEEPAAHLAAIVESRAFLGSRLRVIARAGDCELVLEADNESRLEPRDRIFLRLKAHKLSLWPRVAA